MPVLHAGTALIACVDHFSAAFNLARLSVLAALPGNPFGAEIRRFGADEGAALKVRHPLLRGKNRIHGFRPRDLSLLEDLLTWYKADGLACTVFVPHGEMSQDLFRGLAQAGFWSPGTSIIPVMVPGDSTAPASPEITVRSSGIREKEQYLDLFQSAFGGWPEQEPEYRAFQWAEDSLPGGARYIAEIAGKPAGMASFPVLDGVGYLGTAGVLPEYRRCGVHLALIRGRLRDALRLGCELVVGGNSPDTSAFRNFERAGLHLIPTGSVWRK